MEDERGVSRNMIDELHSSGIQGDQRKIGSGVTRSINDELHSSDFQADQISGESAFTRIGIDVFQS